ncbi:hypothetical protein Prudu_006392 [Prunus dulcis]|uniref:Uncharacterized protein n=1 Tax=Prunus dulcis TaxID=3755 RepID=A0A4Y1QZQ2_PRUDU|nr:hypothetical protein Prudu_006392 [Prunus dulcis]
MRIPLQMPTPSQQDAIRPDVKFCNGNGCIQTMAKNTRGRQEEPPHRISEKNVKLSKVDGTTMIAGILTPPVAMATKRAGENVPQLKMIKAIPDVVSYHQQPCWCSFLLRSPEGFSWGK